MPAEQPTEQAAVIDWGAVEAPQAPPAQPLLQVGAYITNVSDIDLLDNQFSIELLLWTIWHGEPDQNPSDQLRILNGIYDGDIQRFERVRRDQKEGHSWSLYKVRSSVVKRWRLQRYPFDDQLLHVQVGLDDPLQPVNLDVVANEPSSVTPGLLLPGWKLKAPSGYASSISLMNDLGRLLRKGCREAAIHRVVRSADSARKPAVRGSRFPGLSAGCGPLLHELVDHPQPG